MRETQVQSLGWEDPLEKGMKTYSSIPAWRILWAEEPHGYSPWGHRVGHHQVTNTQTVKGFGLVNEADVYLEFCCFFYDPMDVGTLISGSSTFLNPTCTSGSSQFMYSWSLAWRLLSITLLACKTNTILRQFEHSLVLPLFGVGMKTDIFQSCWPLLSFLNLLTYSVQFSGSVMSDYLRPHGLKHARPPHTHFPEVKYIPSVIGADDLLHKHWHQDRKSVV